MKKSIFLFFAAILCAMTANAEKIYLKPSGDWMSAGAIFYVWSWGSSDTGGKMEHIGCGVYEYEIGANTNCKFTRNDPTSTGLWNKEWNATGDLTIQSGKRCYKVVKWNENGSGWEAYADPTPTIAGAEALLGVEWAPGAAENKMIKQGNGTWTLTKTIESIDKGDYTYKVTNGSWDWSLGNGTSDATLNIPANGKYNVTFTYNPSANTVSAVATQVYSVTVNAGEGGTASGTGECVSGNSVNISAEALENYEFVNWTITTGTGTFGNKDVKETTFQPTSNATVQANFRSTITYSLTLQGGTGIASVTGNNDNVTLNQSYNISAEIVDGYSFAGWTADVAANAEITDASLASTSVVVKNGSVVLTASATEITSTLTTANTYSEGTPDIAAPTASVSKVGVATTATITAASNAAYALTSWTLTNCERTDGGAENATEITVKGLGNNNEASVVANYTKIPEETVYLINTEAWETVMVYHWNPRGAAYPGAEMTKTGETIATFDVYEYTFAGSPDGLVFSCGADECKTGDLTWQAGKYYAHSTGEWYADAAAAESALAAVVNYDYYLTGSLVGGWDPKQKGIEKDGELYKATFTDLAAGEYEFKITKGEWAQQWNYSNLDKSYEEVSEGKDGEGNPNGNIKIVTTAVKTITVNFDATANKISLEGLTPYVAPLTYTVTVPAGTEQCFIAGAFAQSNWTTFVEMTKVGDEDKFTIEIVGAKETDQYKYACQADWAYAEVIDGGGNRTQWTALDNVTAWNKPAVITYQLKGVDGWDVAGIEMTENPDKAGEYKLTCQAISATDAVKVVKLADGVITDYYGNGTVKDGVEVTVNYDGDGNITLPEGTYDFYFDTNEAEKKLWIAAATGCAPATATITLVDAQEYGSTLTLSADEYVVGDEITASAQIFDDGFAFAYWKEGDVIVSYSADYTFIVEGDRTLEAYFGMNMPVTMADLAVDGDAMTITGSNTTDGVTASLKLVNYDSDMEMWSVDATNSTLEWRSPMDGTPLNLTVLYGEVWLDMEAYSMAMAKVVADFGGVLYVFNLTMTAASETLEVGVATELSLEFGALVMRGTWYADEEDEIGYPFTATIGGFDYTVAEAEYLVSVELGEWNDDDDSRWLGYGESEMSVAIEDGMVILVGTVRTNYPVNTLNIVAQGMIEILDLNLDATVEEMGGYLHLTAVDDEASGMDFDLYLNDYTGADGEYELNEMSTVAGGAAAATGSLTKSGNTYTGTVYAAAGTLYVFNLTLTEFVPEYENIVITGLSGAAEARTMGWGSEYYLALSLEGTWSDGVETYPVLLEITDGYDAAATSGTMAVSLTIGGMGDDDPWLGNAEGELSYTVVNNELTLSGKMENPYGWPAAVYWDVNISGTILPNYTRDVTADKFGTLCLPFGGTVEGAELYELVKAETNGVLLGSVNKLEAGVPYIFKATASQLAVYCDATVADEAGNHNGLYGTFDDHTEVAAGNYILYNNELRQAEATCYVNANCAYLVMSEVPTEPVQQMPGRRYLGMRVQGGNNTATGLDNITNGENTTIKVIENGQLIIIRGGEKFNAQGQKL